MTGTAQGKREHQSRPGGGLSPSQGAEHLLSQSGCAESRMGAQGGVERPGSCLKGK